MAPPKPNLTNTFKVCSSNWGTKSEIKLGLCLRSIYAQMQAHLFQDLFIELSWTRTPNPEKIGSDQNGLVFHPGPVLPPRADGSLVLFATYGRD